MILSAGITESARKLSVMNGAASVEPSSRTTACRWSSLLDDGLDGQLRHQPGDRQRQLGSQLAPLVDRDAAADRGEPLDAEREVVVVHADGDDVVRVVGDGRRHRAAAQAEAAHEPEADAARRVVALDDGDLREVALVVGHHLAAADTRREHEVLGQDLIAYEPDRADVAAVVGQREGVGRQRRDADAVAHPVRLGRGRERLGDAVSCDDDARP